MAAFGLGPADRVRQRRESAARARDGEKPGDRRYVSRSVRAERVWFASSDRKHADLDRGRPARLRACDVVVSVAGRARAARSCCLPSCRCVRRLDLSPDVRVLVVRGGADFRNGHPVWTRAGSARVQTGSACRDQAGLRRRRQQRRGGRLRGVLVGVQVALCMALMIAAGLLLRGLYATYTIDPGFVYRDVAYVSLRVDATLRTRGGP